MTISWMNNDAVLRLEIESALTKADVPFIVRSERIIIVRRGIRLPAVTLCSF